MFSILSVVLTFMDTELRIIVGHFVFFDGDTRGLAGGVFTVAREQPGGHLARAREIDFSKIARAREVAKSNLAGPEPTQSQAAVVRDQR